MEARFAVNLRADTLDPVFRARLRPWGYLAPPAELNPATRAAAAGLRGEGRGLIVDNGLFDDIGRIGLAHVTETAALHADLDALTDTLGHSPTRRDLSAALRARVDALATATAREASEARGVSTEVQLALRPDAVIGVENVTAATWLRVGLDGPLIPDARRALARRNRVTARAGVEMASRLATEAPGVRYLPVAGALSYDTAFDAGDAFASAGLTAAAIGFGAYMADNSFTDVITIRGRRRKLAGPLPQRYLRSALVARGLWDGWHAATGAAPEAFHFLGLGAPIMIPVVGVAAAETPLLTFDATSPIRDAAEGTLYFSRPTFLKVRTRRAAQRLATGEWVRWSCRCPFCRAFTDAHPFDYERGRQWSSTHVSSVVTPADLRPDGALFPAYPLLAEPVPGPLRGEVTGARSGHNHWVLERIFADLRRHGRSRLDLIAHAEAIVERYTRATSAEHFAIAVRTALDIARNPRPA
jgi:hypothetical protein